MSTIVQLVGLSTPIATALDGHYLIEYDPGRYAMHVPEGCPPLGWQYPHLVTTPDRDKARRFPGFREALEYVRAVDPTHPVRDTDGMPNRPLTSFNVNYERVDP